MLWIVGITQNQKENISELIETFGGLPTNSFKTNKDIGMVWVDGGSTDGTEHVINDAGGMVLYRDWTNDHDYQMNVLLRDSETPIKHGDWVFIVDSQERIAKSFMDKLKNGMIDEFDKSGYKTIYQRSKPILFKYHDDQVFAGSPHWGLTNVRRPILDITKVMSNYKDKDYIWSLRNDKEKWILNGFKYYYVYGRSNHCWLVYDPRRYNKFSERTAHEHEAMRLAFRDFCSDKLGLPRGDTKAFDAYLAKYNEWNPDFVKFFDKEIILKNYFRYTILGETEDYVYETQYGWSFNKWMKESSIVNQ